MICLKTNPNHYVELPEGPLKVVMKSSIFIVKTGACPWSQRFFNSKEMALRWLKWVKFHPEKASQIWFIYDIFKINYSPIFGSLILTQTYIFWVWPEQMRGKITPNPTGLSSPKCQAILFLQAKSEGNIIQI